MIFSQAVKAIKKDHRNQPKTSGVLNKRIQKFEKQGEPQNKVFLRNLSENLQQQDIKDLTNIQFGIKIEKDTAECFFRTHVDAQKFVEQIQGKVFHNKKIKAIIVNENKKAEVDKSSIFSRIQKRT